MNLFEMTEVEKQLYELFTTGDIPEEAYNDTLESIGIEGKLEDYCHVIGQLDADITMFKNEIERLNAKQKSAQKGIDRMKAALSGYMKETGKEKAKAGTYNLSFRKSEAVIIQDELALPNEFVNTKTTTTPDKAAIKRAIKSGVDVPGAKLQENQNLQIK